MGAGRNLEHTPSLAVFAVFIFFLILSFLIETLFHKLEHHFEHKRLHSLSSALRKVKEELMVMGFCSLVLIVFEENILSICVDMRQVRGIPTQMQDQCPCAYMYFRDFVEEPFHRARALEESSVASSGINGNDGSSSSSSSSSSSISTSTSTSISSSNRRRTGSTTTSSSGSSSGSSSSSSSSSSTTSSSSSSGREARSSIFDTVAGPVRGCEYKEGFCGPDWSVLMCCSKYENFRIKMGSKEMLASECETTYKIEAGATNTSQHISGHRLLWETPARRTLAAGKSESCPAGQETFIEQAALHQTHTVIFYIAMVHITLGVFSMWFASKKIKRWSEWEHYGDDDNEDPAHLDIPPPRGTGIAGLKRIICSCKEQFTQSVCPASYIAIRRFYISKNKALHDKPPGRFQFNKEITSHINVVSSNILGISPWMWLTLGLQIILEGYGFGTFNIFTQISLVCILISGAKLQMVSDHLTRKVYEEYKCIDKMVYGKNIVKEKELGHMQTSTEYQLFDHYEPEFWMNNPKIIETMIKFCIWQISVSFTLFGYFSLKFEAASSFHTCYWESRTAARMIPDLTIMVGTILVAAFRVVPVYGVVSLAARHNDTMTRRRLKNFGGHGHEHEEKDMETEGGGENSTTPHRGPFSSGWKTVQQRLQAKMKSRSTLEQAYDHAQLNDSNASSNALKKKKEDEVETKKISYEDTKVVPVTTINLSSWGRNDDSIGANS